MTSGTVPNRTLQFVVPGRLGAWQRMRLDTRGGKPIAFTSAKMRADQAMIRQLGWQALKAQCRTKLEGPLRLTVETTRTIPPSWSKARQHAAMWITSKPDLDNTLKQIADALNHVAYGDDAQIAECRCSKRYGASDQVLIMVEELGEV